ncbi:MAG: hypothetical protein ACAI44_14985 [Candidatus Sericytochromatia bacterium]
MSGDLYVRVRQPENAGGRFNNNVNIDANSVSSGNMTTPVNVGGRQVFMTEQGAARYAQLTAPGRNQEYDPTSPGRSSVAVHSDPSWISKFFFGHSEEAVGNP